MHQEVDPPVRNHQDYRWKIFQGGEDARKCGEPRTPNPYKAIAGPGLDNKRLWLRGWDYEDRRMREEAEAVAKLRGELDRRDP